MKRKRKNTQAPLCADQFGYRLNPNHPFNAWMAALADGLRRVGISDAGIALMHALVLRQGVCASEEYDQLCRMRAFADFPEALAELEGKGVVARSADSLRLTDNPLTTPVFEAAARL